MSERGANLPLEQQATRDQRFNPSGTFVGFPIEDVETSIPARFEKIVEMYSDQVAVRTEDRSLTYDQLNRVANRLAHAILAHRGNKVESVALALSNCVDLVIAVLAVLKSNKFFVLLDPLLPLTRMTTILADAQASVVVTDSEIVRLAIKTNPDLCALIQLDASADNSCDEDLCLSIPSDALASVAYTSGSTGQPKGVCQTHRNVLHRVMLHSRDSGIDPNDRITLLTSSTSNAITNIFNSVLTGATLCPFDVKKQGIHRFADWLAREEISICFISATLFRSLCQVLQGSNHFPHLRFLRIRSESAYKSDVELFQKHFSVSCALVNGLSSSETGPLCAYFIHHSTEIAGSELPVGFALQDKEILLLDDDGKAVGCNQVGEIVVRSRYLSPGYWRQPDLTATKFKSDPNEPEKRLYYSGDLGLMLPNGCLIHKGRKDLMVKIRGFNVNLNEIERALLEHTEVKDAGVASWEREPGEKYLVGYVVRRQESALNVSDLNEHLRTKLPDYMIPTGFVFLQSLPLKNGKLDRKALPKLDHKRPDLKTAYVPPSTDIEKRLCQIWSGVLSVEQVGIHDNFFDLGGHSLLAAQLFTRLDDEFGRLLPLSVLFAAPTVHLLAEQYSSSTESRKISPLVPLVPSGGLPPVYAVPGVFGNVVGFVDLSRELGSEQPFYALQSIGLDGAQTPIDSIEEMAKLYLSEVREIQLHGPYVLIGACFGARVAYEMTRQLHEADEEVAFLGLLDPIGLQRDNAASHLSRVPPSINRAKALRSFFTDRLELYFEELRRLDNIDRILFVAKKIRSLSFKIGDRRAIRSVQREFHQLEVFKASKIAGRQYLRRPLEGRLRALEIFESSHPRNNTKDDFDWTSLWQGHVVRHRVPGKDSSDMLIGDNARVLATILGQRLRAVLSPESDVQRARAESVVEAR